MLSNRIFLGPVPIPQSNSRRTIFRSRPSPFFVARNSPFDLASIPQIGRTASRRSRARFRERGVHVDAAGDCRARSISLALSRIIRPFLCRARDHRRVYTCSIDRCAGYRRIERQNDASSNLEASRCFSLSILPLSSLSPLLELLTSSLVRIRERDPRADGRSLACTQRPSSSCIPSVAQRLSPPLDPLSPSDF